MSVLWAGVLYGAGAWLAIGVVVGAFVDDGIREGLLRVLLGPVGVLVIALSELGMRLPALKRHRVTPDSLRAAMDDDTYDRRTLSIGWPGGALVLLRTRKRDTT